MAEEINMEELVGLQRCAANGVTWLDAPVTGGTEGARAGTLGALQATEVVKEILGIGQSLSGRLVMYDALAGSFDEMAIAKRPNCPTCGHA